MTTAKPKIRTPFRLPDPPEHPDDKMTSSKHLSETASTTTSRNTWATPKPPSSPASAT